MLTANNEYGFTIGTSAFPKGSCSCRFRNLESATKYHVPELAYFAQEVMLSGMQVRSFQVSCTLLPRHSLLSVAMDSCLPFMLLGFSFPLTLQSKVSDCFPSEPIPEQRRTSGLSGPRPEFVDTQPSPRYPQTLSYRRFNQDRRLGPPPYPGINPRSAPILRRPRSGRFKRVKNGTVIRELPAIHESGFGAELDDKAPRRQSNPERSPGLMIELDEFDEFDEFDEEMRRSYDATSARSSFTLPSIRVSMDRLSSTSTLVSNTSPPPQLSEQKMSSVINSPLLKMIEEDVKNRSLELRDIKMSLKPLLEDHKGVVVETARTVSIQKFPGRVTYCRSPSTTESTQHDSQIPTTPDSAGSIRSPKKSSFCSESPRSTQSFDVIEKERALEPYSSWTDRLELSSLPPPAHPVVDRRALIHSISEIAPPSLFSRRQHQSQAPLGRGKGRIRVCVISQPRTDASNSEQTVEFIDSKIHTSPAKEMTEEKDTIVQHAEPTQTIVITPRPRKPERAFSIEQRAVRHWSMTGNGSWARRGGTHGQVPHLIANVKALRV
ncbi:hypothetical protein EJ04DRAFT_525468 [Polyplosphaeria fusca]|uniref:Uncharacterized protein n=1 Tax=Polyplosphaeria fusca TaxID=682080 RepID=A0A9P4V1I3_9PLEO|nr:hypothetical protein EJ04DRAFT_525468 [Polyplosphaeria fusca]